MLFRSGMSVLKFKETLRVASHAADIVIADLTWVDTLQPRLFLEFDLILIPASLSGIEICSLHDFFKRFAAIFNSAKLPVPKIAVVPTRLNNIADYCEVFSKSGFLVKFNLLSPIMYSKIAQDCFGRGYLFSCADADLRQQFSLVCAEIKQMCMSLKQRRELTVGDHSGAPLLNVVNSGVLERFVTERSASRSPVTRVAGKSQKQWFQFLRRQG